MELVRKRLAVGTAHVLGIAFIGFGILCSAQAFVAPSGDFTQDYIIVMTGLAYMSFGIMVVAFNLNRPKLAGAALIMAVICILDVGGICINLASQAQNSPIWWPTLYELVFT